VHLTGSTPGDAVNPVALEIMAEAGIDIFLFQPQGWTTGILAEADVVVSMGYDEKCLIPLEARVLEWEIDDPAGVEVVTVRTVRDQIEIRVRTLLTELLEKED
jgi:arsenate reductase